MNCVASWDCPRQEPIFDAKHSPHLVLALFSRVLGGEQKDGRSIRSLRDFGFTMRTRGTPRCRSSLKVSERR